MAQLINVPLERNKERSCDYLRSALCRYRSLGFDNKQRCGGGMAFVLPVILGIPWSLLLGVLLLVLPIPKSLMILLLIVVPPLLNVLLILRTSGFFRSASD